jgi:hypothetical protein
MEERVWENKELEIIETSESYLIREGYVPPVHDFVLEHYITGEDRTQDILESPKTLLVIAYDLDHSNISHWNQIKALAQDSRSQGIDVVGLSASSGDLIDKVRQEYSLEFDFFNCDETTLKTIIRSNPGVVYLEKGTVVQKWPFRSLPESI